MRVHSRNLFLLSIPVARMLLTPNSKVGKQTKRCEKVTINIWKLKVGVKHSISRRTTFSPNPHLVEETTCFLFFAPWCDLNWTIKAYVSAKRTQIYIPLESTCCLFSMPTVMSSVTGESNHTMDLFYLLKENFKNLLFDTIITEKSFENLSYLSSCSLSQRRKFWRICSNVLQGIEYDLAYTKVSGVVS